MDGRGKWERGETGKGRWGDMGKWGEEKGEMGRCTKDRWVRKKTEKGLTRSDTWLVLSNL